MEYRSAQEIIDSQKRYEVNEYTIKYDDEVKAFLKNKLPNSVQPQWQIPVVLGTVGLLSLATGGVAGLVLGAACAAGAVAGPVLYKAIKSRELPKHIRKEIKASYKSAKARKVATHDNLIVAAIENIYSFSKAGIEVKNENELKYYLNVLLKEAKEHSLAINKAKNNKYISETKKDNILRQHNEQLEKIVDAVKILASYTREVKTRNGIEFYNPFKAIVLEALCGGCLLAKHNKDQDNIRNLAFLSNKKEAAATLYASLFEKEVLRDIDEQLESVKQTERMLAEERKKEIEAQQALLKKAGNVREVEDKNQALAATIDKQNDILASLKHARQIAAYFPSEMSKDKAKIMETINKLSQAVKDKNEEQISNQKELLDKLIEDAYDKIMHTYWTKGNNARKQSFNKLMEAYKQLDGRLVLGQKALAEEKASHSNTRKKLGSSLKRESTYRQTAAESMWDAMSAVRSEKEQLDAGAEEMIKVYESINLDRKPITIAHLNFIKQFHDSKKLTEEDRQQYWLSLRVLNNGLAQHKSEELANALEQLKQTEVERDEAAMYAIEGAHEARVNAIKLEQEREKHAKATKRGIALRNKANKLAAENVELSQNLEESNEYLMNTTHELVKAERARKQSEDDLEYALSGWYDADLAKQEAFKTIDTQAKEIKFNIDAIEGLQSQLYDVSMAEEVAYRSATTASEHLAISEAETKRAKKRASTAEGKVKKVTKELGEERIARVTAESKAETLASELSDAQRRLNEAEDHIETLVQGQSENIYRIMDLEAKNKDLSTGNELYRSTSEALAWDFHNLSKKVERLTEDNIGLTNGIFVMKNSFEETLQEKNDKIISLQSDKIIQNHNRDVGRAVANLKRLMNKAEAHARVSKEAIQSTNKDIETVLSAVALLKARDLKAIPMDELKTCCAALQALYQASQKGLVKVDKKELRELGTQLGAIVRKRESAAKKGITK